MLELICLLFDSAMSSLFVSAAVRRPFAFIDGHVPFALMLALVYVLYAALKAFTHRERSIYAVIALVAGIYIAGLAAFTAFFAGGWKLMELAMLWTGMLYPVLRAVQYCFKPLKTDCLIQCFECGLLATGVCLLVDSGLELGHGWLIPAVIAMGACTAAMLLVRINGSDVENANPALSIPAAILASAAVFGVIALGFVFIYVPYEKGVAAVLKAIAAVIAFIGSLLWRIVYFLLTLLPDGEAYTDIEQESMPEMVMELAEEERIGDGRLLYALIAVMLIATVVLVLVKLKGLKIRAAGTVRGNGRKKKNSGRFRRYLALLLGNIKNSLLLKAAMIRKRNSCTGCYYWLVDKNAHGRLKKLNGETPGEYLARLAEAKPSAAEVLNELSERLYAELYGGADTGAFHLSRISEAWK